MLTRVSIQNYNCFADFALELPQTLLVVGSNGSGKSSLWGALAALQDLILHGEEVGGVFPTRSVTRWRADAVQRFSLDLQPEDRPYNYNLELRHDVERQLCSIHEERLMSGDQVLYELTEGEVRIYGDVPRPDGRPRTNFHFGRKRSFLGQIESRPDNKLVWGFLEALRRIWLIKPSAARMEPTTADEALLLARDGTNFPSWFRSVLADRPEVGALLNEALGPVFPGLSKVGFEKVSHRVRELFLHFQFEGAPYPLSVSELSDGQRGLLLLHGLLVGALDRVGTLFIDEPELGLAPHELQPWLAQARAALDAHHGQLFVSSHHPAVIDYLAPERTLRFSRPGGGPTRVDDITLETTDGARVSEWLTRSWAYEDEHGAT